MPKRKCLKLFTKTWPPKDKENDDEPTRPLTATLEKPMILDISFIDKIDMTLMRKEFFSLTNLCRLPITISLEKIAGKQQDGTRRPLSLPSSEKFLGKRSKNLDSSEEDNSLSSVRSKLVKAKTGPRRYPITHSLSDTNNNTKAYKLPKKLPPTTPVAPSPPKSNKLPQPCKTCGRFDQPERLHSHPVTQPRCSRKMEEKIPVKNSVQKPVAIRYKPRNQLSPQKLPTAKKSLPQETKQVTKSEVNRVKSAKRTLTCYLCGREFGTASLHLHEPKCLEKWQRENNKLPPHLRRKPPPKPDHHLSQEEWNKFAWDASQMTLVPCENCGRTFLPDRLVVHQRSCKAPSKMGVKLPVGASPPAYGVTPTQNLSQTLPQRVPCAVCGRLFGSRSIKIHEPQCIKKAETQGKSQRVDCSLARKNTSQISKEYRPTSTGESNKRPPIFPCYLCGELFSVHSIAIHEPQCLKKWRIENDKLPPHKRRPEPVKEEFKYTDDGKLDLDATCEAMWRSHLSQLVPCKYCSRTFNPDRVAVHERSCKGKA